MASSWLCPELPAVPRQFVSCLAEQRLVRGVPASEREEANRTTGEHDLSADEAVRPMSVNRKHVSEEWRRAMVIRAPEVNQLAARRPGGVEPPLPREWAAGRGLRRASASPVPGRGDVSKRPALQRAERAVVEAMPHLRLPPAVEVLERGLEARILDGREHRGTAGLQAKLGDLSHNVRELVRSLGAVVVVGRGERRDPAAPPALLQGAEDARRGHAGAGPRVRPAGVQREAREHLDLRTALQHEPFDDIEAVAVCRATGDLGQVPAAGWRGATDPALAVEGAPTLQDPANGPYGGRPQVVTGHSR